LVPAPLYHTNGFGATMTLLDGEPIVLMERFNAERVLDLIERHRVSGFIGATPMLHRIAKVPGVTGRDLSSIQWVLQGASPIPQWLARFWCDLIGPERLYFGYGSTENVGIVRCRGDDWLEHPGTLGRGWPDTEIRILAPDGSELPPGEVGDIYMRSSALGEVATYRGEASPIPFTVDGFATIGDLGWLDEEGYLYLADRRVDLIVTGGANVYPAEVEAALSECPGVDDVVVIGLADPVWDKRVHALIQPTDSLKPVERRGLGRRESSFMEEDGNGDARRLSLRHRCRSVRGGLQRRTPEPRGHGAAIRGDAHRLSSAVTHYEGHSIPFTS